ncbi:two-component system, NarL family, sensor histidine kinase LiaS [Halalkalibacter nanhaiisediminis]|uniref:Sensor histidine kinase n=1 Tax=Halalkalibacter nanhaiisediminis TaxID=688079 RepID=A0A562QJ78_9BACI|nr:two-component system, NarL family, sensor histidine kinase LiaS [Halalkalibacter nanhaiisediminis]
MARLQWQFIRHSFIVSLLTSFFLIFLVTYEDDRGLLLVFDRDFVGIPIAIWMILVIVVTGLMSGYIQAAPIRRRIDQLVHGATRYERGTFSHRVEVEGEDEVAELAERMNGMAQHIEEQVASLQRLSKERVKMQETVKKAAVTEERQRLARDLHDAVSQQLFAISMMTAAIKQNLQNTSDSTAVQVAMVENMANTAQAEMRALLLHLRPAHLEGKSLEEGMHTLLNELEQKYQVKVHTIIDQQLSIPRGIEDQLFRMIQEAISNVLRHAKATQLEFQMRQTSQELKVKLIDNGVGFDTKIVHQGSYGLHTMRERINEIGGTLHIVSVPEKGTQIEANIPIAWKEEQDDSNTSS